MTDVNPAAYELKSIISILQTQNEGDDLVRADTHYRQVMAAVTAHIAEHGGSASGVITLKIKVAGDAKGVDVTVESDSTKPKAPPPPKVRYFATDRGDGLTLKNPNKGTMLEGIDLGRRRRGDVG